MRSFKELRTDPHRPSVIDPAEYVFVGAADDHPGDSYLEIRHDILARHGVETGSSDRYSSANVPFYDAYPDGRPNYRCHHCGKHGSNIRYFCFFLHKPSGQVIVVGQICAKKLSLGSREELDFQKRADEFRRMQQRHQWVADHQDEYNFLKEYDEQNKQDGWYSEFFESLWNRIQHQGHLTDGQVTGLRKWMTRGQPWKAIKTIEAAPHIEAKLNVSQVNDLVRNADRHKAQVTRTADIPTEAQIDYIEKLADELDNLVGIDSFDMPETRLAASDLINSLKAQVIEQRNAVPDAPGYESATEKQISYINVLMEERQISVEARRKARTMLDEGLSKSQASGWIVLLLRLPRLEDA